MDDERLKEETPAMAIANDIMSIRQTGTWDDFHAIAVGAVEQAVRLEREACAKTAQDYYRKSTFNSRVRSLGQDAADGIAKAIRERT